MGLMAYHKNTDSQNFSFVFLRTFLQNEKGRFYKLRRHFWTLLHKIKVAQNSILHNKSDRPNYFDEI